MLTGYLERSSSHGPMLAYLMLHLQVGIRTQTRTEIATLSTFCSWLIQLQIADQDIIYDTTICLKVC